MTTVLKASPQQFVATPAIERIAADISLFTEDLPAIKIEQTFKVYKSPRFFN